MNDRKPRIAAKSPPRRITFRHGNLRGALVCAAIARLKAESAELITLRNLARDVGVNHRALYRHFPNKMAVLASVAERGWQQLAHRLTQSARGSPPGERALVAASVALFQFASEFPNLFHLMCGIRMNTEGKFPDLEAATIDALKLFAVDFAAAGMAPGIVVERTAVFAAALQGIVTQILRHRLKIAPAKAHAFIGEISRMMIKGVR